MTVFLESQTGLGLILPQATHNAWENIFWDNHHVSSWVAEAQNRGSRLLGGSLNVAALENVEVQWVFEDGSTDRLTYPSATITNLDPLVRKVYYAEYDQTTPANSLIKKVVLPQFADFSPTEFQFPLVQVGFKQESLETSTAFVKWIAPRDPQGASAQVMPVGTILMYDGTNWQDNVTMKGWYACVGGQVPSDGRPASGLAIPDFQNKFIMGSTTSAQTGGSNTMLNHIHNTTSGGTLTAAAQNWSGSTGAVDLNHSHSATLTRGQSGGAAPSIFCGSTTWDSSPGTGWTNVANTNLHHAHSVSGSNSSSTVSGTIGGGADVGLNTTDSRPAFYTLIFIKRFA